MGCVKGAESVERGAERAAVWSLQWLAGWTSIVKSHQHVRASWWLLAQVQQLPTVGVLVLTQQLT